MQRSSHTRRAHGTTRTAISDALHNLMRRATARHVGGYSGTLAQARAPHAEVERGGLSNGPTLDSSPRATHHLRSQERHMITRPSTGTLFRPRKREIGLSRPHVGQIMCPSLGLVSGVIPEHWP